MFDKDGRLEMFPKHGPASKPMGRPKGTKPPCESCPKITGLSLTAADGPPRPALAVELNDRNRQAWEHYKRCRAVNWQTPDAQDELVQHHAAVIREIEDQMADQRAAMLSGLLAIGRK